MTGCPDTGWPQSLTWLPLRVMSEHLLAEIPSPLVPVTVKPCTVTQFRLESVKP